MTVPFTQNAAGRIVYLRRLKVDSYPTDRKTNNKTTLDFLQIIYRKTELS
jgi:hypothetical protein